MPEEVRNIIRRHAEEGMLLRERFFTANAAVIEETGRTMAICLARGGKLLFCGNGGSAADCQHLAAEFVNRFMLDRPPLAAIALTANTSTLTAVGNDFGFDLAFAKQVQALGNVGDILVGLSTSGNSENVIRALMAARENEMLSISITGSGGGRMAEFSDILIPVEGATTALVQEVHIALGHILCSLVDYYLFQNALALAPYLDAEA